MATNQVIEQARAELRDLNDRVAQLTAEWWREAIAKGISKAPPWPPDGAMTLLRARNEARERVEMATGLDPDKPL